MLKNYSNQNLNYRADIDGLRAVAVCLVLFFHFFPQILPAGFIGVDIFFVISGYLISHIILKELREKNFSFSAFYLRRVRRIFPSLILVLSACIVCGWYFLLAFEYLEFAKQSLSGVLFLANFELFRESGYFDVEAQRKVLLHLWSLAIEEQFYIFWPLLLFIQFKRHKNDSTKAIKYILLLIGLVIFASFFLNIFFVRTNQSAAFYLPICRFWEILFGSLLAALEINSQKSSLQQGLRIRSWLGLATILAALFLIKSANNFPGYWALLPCFGAALIISDNNSWFNRHILSNKILVGIGLISYPLYLWHWPLISFATIVKGRHPRPELSLLLIFVSFLLAYLSYKFCELPLRKFSIKSKKMLYVLFGAMLLILLSSLVIINFNGLENRGDAKKNALIRSMNRGGLTNDRCLEVYKNKVEANYCKIFGSGSKNIVVIGDSHSQAIFDAYAAEISADFTITHLANSGCPFFVDESFFVNYDAATLKDIKKCNENFSKIISIIKELKPVEILFINNGWRYRKFEFELGLNKVLKEIGRDVPIVYFSQVPRCPISPTSCLNRLKEGQEISELSCNFERKKFDKELEDYWKILAEIHKNNHNFIVFDTALALCDERVCRIISDEKFMYNYDGSHLSTDGGKAVVKKFKILSKKR